MKIIKRNGAEESFDTLKIVNAVQKACNATENAYLAPEQLTDIADYVEYKCNKLGRAVSVEEIQDMVENQLMAIWLERSARISREDFFFRKILLRRISRESSTSMTPTILHSICTTAIL